MTIATPVVVPTYASPLFGTMQNPFTNEYLEQELQFYGTHPDAKKGGVVFKQISGRSIIQVSDYFNRNMRLDVPEIPGVLLDGELQMSLSFMEAQSQWVPIEAAEGVVVTLGLGLGYYMARVMAKEDVDVVYVFEQNQDIIDIVTERFSDRMGFEKVEFFVGDAREQFVNFERVDLVYADIYPTMLPDEVVSDMDLFHRNNELSHYHFWGMEHVLLDGLIDGEIDQGELDCLSRLLIAMWQATPLGTDEEDGDMGNMSDLYEKKCYGDFLTLALETIARHNY